MISHKEKSRIEVATGDAVISVEMSLRVRSLGPFNVHNPITARHTRNQCNFKAKTLSIGEMRLP